MKEYYELIKKIDLADKVNKEIGGNFGRTITITMGEALIVKHLLKKQANGIDASHETALNKPVVNQQRELLLAFCDHLNTYAGMEEIRFDFMMQDFIDKSQ